MTRSAGSHTLNQRTRPELVAILIVALLAVALVVKVCLTAATHHDAVLGARFAASDPRSLTLRADAAMIETGDTRAAAALARQAISRDATLATPFRILALDADQHGDQAAARRLIASSTRLSRRDLGAQLWLIEDAVRANDVARALEHFDIALRTSDKAPAILYPILANAVAEPEIVRALAARMRRAPWGASFAVYAMDHGTELRGLVALANQLAAIGDPIPPTVLGQLTNRLAEKQAFGLLGPLRRLALGPSGARALSDPRFDKPVNVPVYDWSLAADGVAQVFRGADGQRGGLTFEIPFGRQAELARQLVTLPPGHYRLQAAGQIQAIANPADRPRWTVQCASGDKVMLGTFPMQSRGSGASDFTVPAGCDAQWLVLASPPANQAVSGTVNEVRLIAL